MSHVLFNAESLTKIAAYDVVRDESLPDISGHGVVLWHKKSGANIAVISTNDNNKVFSIGFQTLPEDSTGVAHVLEHSVLCGSKRFPVKEPFAELAKGSFNTFLNAMTYPDKTVYPVASCNEKEFMNLMEVYLDAVFFPNIYTQKEIFLQEGWRYELEDESENIVCNGVVYNEMKGAFSNPEKLLLSEVQSALFPDTVYGVKSGGDPEHIPDLTYETLLSFHERYYHPSNSYIYLYGNMDVPKCLDWIDREYLCCFEKRKVDTSIKMQQGFDTQRRHECFYPVNTEEEIKNGYFVSFGVSLAGGNDEVKKTAIALLSSVLVNSQGAPLRRVLKEADIGTDIYIKYIDEVKQPFLTIVAKNVTEDRAEVFLDVLKEALRKIADDGISKKTLLAELNRMEFLFREGDSGLYPKGLRYGQQVMATWLYNENDVFDKLHMSPVFEKLRMLVETGYFEELLREVFLDNKHAVFLKMLPKIGLHEEKETALKKKLESYKKKLSKEQITSLVTQTKDFKRYQGKASDADDLAKIPHLVRGDMKREVSPLVNEVKDVSGVTMLHQALSTGGIAYVKILFDMKKVDASYFPYVGLIKDLFGRMDTKHRCCYDLNNDISINTGGIGAKVMVVPKYDDLHEYKVFFVVEGKVLYNRIPELFGYFRELLVQTTYNDTARIKEVLLERKSNMERKFSVMGQEATLKRAASYFSEMGVAMELLDGIAYYEFVSELLVNYEERKEEMVDKLRWVCETILTKDTMLFSVTADGTGYNLVKEQCDILLKCFASEAKVDKLVLKSENKNEAFMIASPVQSICCAGNYRDAGVEYTGAYEVLHSIMNYGYLWEHVRVRGGAYGAAFMALENGRMAFYSWRDPHLARTMALFKNAVEYIENFEADEEEMTKYIIGTFRNLDIPLSPQMEGERGLIAYLTGRNLETMQNQRNEIMDVTVEKIRGLAPGIRKVLEQGYCCVIGNQTKINENAKCFATIKQLIK